MSAKKGATQRSTLVQLGRVLWYEEPWFIFYLVARTARYYYAKYIRRQAFIVKRIHGSLMQLDLNDPGISRSLLLVGDREKEHRYMLARTLRPGDSVLDVGANIGFYALMERQLTQGQGRVVAIEPSPANYRQLLKNIALNGAQEQIIAIQAALAEDDGEAKLHLSRLSNVHSLIASQVPQPLNRSVAVPALSLATITERFGSFDLLRMDIEGYEYTVLRTLVTLNQTCQFLPRLLFELHPPKYVRADFTALLQDLFKLGYRARYVACSHRETLQQAGITIVHSVKTDGTIRYIGTGATLSALEQVVYRSRALLLEVPSYSKR